MIEEIKKRLEAGEVVELECVDRVGAFYGLSLEKTKGKLEGLLRVKEVDHNDIHFESGEFIEESELKYFRIAEDKSTFDDLIDVAVQAYKDGIADKLAIGYDGGIERVMLHVNGYANSYYQSSAVGNHINHINHINSLYTETFVIEQDGDIQKLKGEPNISLANGNEFVAKKMKIGSNSRGMFAISFIDIDGYEMTYAFFELKGATVTQKRENK